MWTFQDELRKKQHPSTQVQASKSGYPGSSQQQDYSDGLSYLFEHKERTINPFDEQIELVNLGSKDDIKEVKIGSQLHPEVKKGLVELLREYSIVFAWSYQDMPGLGSDIMEHRFPLKPECPPVK